MSLKYLARICETVIFIRVPLPRRPHPAAGTSENRQAPLRCILCSHRASVKQRTVPEARGAAATWYFVLLIGGHRVRPRLLDPDPGIVLRGAVADYQRALAAGDLEVILAAYEPDATIREPSGGPYVYRGVAKIREIYTLMFASGGIPIQHC